MTDYQTEGATNVGQSYKKSHVARRGVSPLASQYGSIETIHGGKEIENRISALEN